MIWAWQRQRSRSHAWTVQNNCEFFKIGYLIDYTDADYIDYSGKARRWKLLLKPAIISISSPCELIWHASLSSFVLFLQQHSPEENSVYVRVVALAHPLQRVLVLEKLELLAVPFI